MKKVAPNRIFLVTVALLPLLPYMFFALYYHQNLILLLVISVIFSFMMCLGYSTFCYNDFYLEIKNSYADMLKINSAHKKFIMSNIEKVVVRDVGERGGATITITYNNRNHKFSYGMTTNEKDFKDMIDFLNMRIPEVEIIGSL